MQVKYSRSFSFVNC